MQPGINGTLEYNIFHPKYEECMQEVRRDLVIVTAGTSALACFLMGVAANLPLALAPGMGINAYFTYSVVGFRGTGPFSYEQALGAVFIEGIVFMVLAASGMRQLVVKCFPNTIRFATAGGIGMFLATLGLQTAEGIGLVVSDGATGMTMGGCPPENRVPFYACPLTKGLGQHGIPDGLEIAGPGAFAWAFHPNASATPAGPLQTQCLKATPNVYVPSPPLAERTRAPPPAPT